MGLLVAAVVMNISPNGIFAKKLIETEAQLEDAEKTEDVGAEDGQQDNIEEEENIEAEESHNQKMYRELVAANGSLGNPLPEKHLESFREIIENNGEVFKDFADIFPEKQREKILRLIIRELTKLSEELINMGLNTNMGREMLVEFISESLYDSSNIKTTEIEVETEVGDNYRILFLADLQLENLLQSPSEIKEYISSQNPDILILGGDIIEGVNDIDLVQEYISGIEVKQKYYVNGNHEYYINEIDRYRLKGILKEEGFIDLNNTNEAYQGFNLIGIDDITSNMSDIQKAYQDIPDNKINIIVTHNHDVNYELDSLGKRADLIISGHTHGGQIQSFLIPLNEHTRLWADQGHYSGEYEYKGVNLNYRNYTSNGIGGSGVALRLGVQQEGLIVNIVSKSEAVDPGEEDKTPEVPNPPSEPELPNPPSEPSEPKPTPSSPSEPDGPGYGYEPIEPRPTKPARETKVDKVEPKKKIDNGKEVAKEIFVDIAHSPYKKEIERLREYGYIVGSGENKFNPDNTITRAELVEMIVKGFGLKEKNSNLKTYQDVKDVDWYARSIRIATENGLVVGNGDGTFNPNGAITRQEVMIVLKRLITQQKLNIELNNSMAELTEVDIKASGWARKSIEYMIDIGIAEIDNVDYRDNPNRDKIAKYIHDILEKAGLLQN